MSLLANSVTYCPGTRMHDDYAHRPFVCTNEEDHAKVLAQLSKLPVHGDTVVGVSCFALLNMILIIFFLSLK